MKKNNIDVESLKWLGMSFLPSAIFIAIMVIALLLIPYLR